MFLETERQIFYRQLFTKEPECFPNGQKLVEVLKKINNMPWFCPTKEPKRGLLNLNWLVGEYLKRLNPPESLQEISLEIIKKDWNVALKAARDVTKGVAWEVIFKTAIKAKRDSEWNGVYNVVRDGVESVVWDKVRTPILEAARKNSALDAAVDGAWNVARKVAYDAAGYASWTILDGLMPKEGFSYGNPLEALMEIYQMGYWPIGLTVKDQKQFLIFIPAGNLRVSDKSRKG